MKVNVNFNAEGVESRIRKNTKRAQFALDQQVAKDSNYFCPEDVGSLQDSVFPVEGKGELIWNEPYAKRQYYELPNKSKDKNPNAMMQWFEQAKARWKKRWEKVANAEFNR